MHEGTNTLVLEAPGGLARVTANCRAGRVESVTVTNHPVSRAISMLSLTLKVLGAYVSIQPTVAIVLQWSTRLHWA